GIRSAIAQPLVVRGEVVGSIVFATVDERTFDQAAIDGTLEIAHRVGLAIVNGRAHEAEQRARRAAEELADRMERLQAVTRTLADAPTIEDVVAIVADEAKRALGADSVVVGLLDETANRLDLVVRDGDGSPFPDGGPVADGGPIAERARTMPLDAEVPLAIAVREARPVWIEGNAGAEAGGGAAPAEGDEPSGSAVPLVADQAPLGGLWLGFREPRTFAPADQRLVRAYADLAAGAIVRLRLGAVRQLLLSANEAERARLESVLRRMPIGVILAAVPNGRFVYANEAAHRLSPRPVELDAAPDYEAARGYRTDGSELGPDDWPLRRAMHGETVENEVIEIHYGDGTR